MIALSRSFVPVADEVWRLQRGSEADCLFFQKTVNGGERITDGGTRQGVWVIAPGGALLAHVNSRNPDRVVEVLKAGLAAWDELPQEQRHLATDVDITPAHRWEQSWPARGLVLERIARDISADGLDGERSTHWNRDTVWVSRGELSGLIPEELIPGNEFPLALLARRLARFHLLDNAAGQSIPFADEELQRAELTARVTSLQGGRATLELRGSTRADADGLWRLGFGTWTPSQELPHGIETELLGEALFNTASRRFERLQLVALGRRWGRTENNGRGRDPSPALIAFLLRLPADKAPHIAPTFVSLYDADWIARPAVATWVRSPDECEAALD